MASGDRQIVNFRMPEEDVERLSKAAFDLDITKTALIRTCLELALPLIQARPDLVSILTDGPKTRL
jgi:predicted DNA-binding protein